MCIGDSQVNSFTMKSDRENDAVILLVSIAPKLNFFNYTKFFRQQVEVVTPILTWEAMCSSRMTSVSKMLVSPHLNEGGHVQETVFTIHCPNRTVLIV